ncbi:phosphate signaling complex protein PhoU [Marinicellulosiphila megalodicopiae]|uniref:phosphate signaling complex protein PhoU n=1 Tax=Marinicellulosiphila megalodicopiae TaxID=2724896 RepID=UPI003BB18538
MDKLNLDQHISNKFNEELEEARQHLMQMGGMVEQQVKNSITAIIEADSALAQEIRAKDESVNDMEMDIDEECARILALRHPAASDLRFVLAVTKAVNDLERIGDEASKIAKQAIELTENGAAPKGYIEIRHIGNLVVSMLNKALDAFARSDAELALDVLQDDKVVNMEYASAMREMVTLMMEDPRMISRALNVMWALRSLERIGDHSQNICEYVIYLVKGKDIRHKKLSKVKKAVKK